MKQRKTIKSSQEKNLSRITNEYLFVKVPISKNKHRLTSK